jgi:hypothetical protein
MDTDQTTKRGAPVPTQEMLQQIWNELRYVRGKLDSHADQNQAEIAEIKDDVAEVKDQLTGQKVKLGLILTVFGLAVTGTVSLIVNHLTA